MTAREDRVYFPDAAPLLSPDTQASSSKALKEQKAHGLDQSILTLQRLQWPREPTLELIWAKIQSPKGKPKHELHSDLRNNIQVQDGKSSQSVSLFSSHPPLQFFSFQMDAGKMTSNFFNILIPLKCQSNLKPCLTFWRLHLGQVQMPKWHQNTTVNAM